MKSCYLWDDGATVASSGCLTLQGFSTVAHNPSELHLFSLKFPITNVCVGTAYVGKLSGRAFIISKKPTKEKYIISEGSKKSLQPLSGKPPSPQGREGSQNSPIPAQEQNIQLLLRCSSLK